MSSSPTPIPAPEAPPPPQKITIISHTGLFYWWPVWLTGFILGGLTLIDGDRMAIVPAGTKVTKASSDDKRFELTVPDKPTPSLDTAVKNTKDGVEAFPIRVGGNESYGVVYLTVLLLVIFGSNVPLRGMSSLVAGLLILVIVIVLAYFDAWPRIFDFIGGLRVHFSTEAFLVPSVVLLLMWLGTVFLYDRLRYMSFSPGQFILHKDIGDLRQVYDTTQITAEKCKTDYLRHWVLGLGAGDIIITVPNQNVTIEMPNVLFIDRRLREIADLMKTKPVIPG
jgi:hypothetical protein